MKKRVIKFIVCFVLVCAMMIGFCTAFASAATPVWLLRAKAGIAAAMMAANISFEAIHAAQGQALANAIDPLGIVQTINDTSWDQYIDQSVIVVRPDYVTIDGEPYTEIWLGSDAANALRASGFDFRTAYNLLDNQGTPVIYADGRGYIGGIPVYFVDNKFKTQTFRLADGVDNAVGIYTVKPYYYSSTAPTRRRFEVINGAGETVQSNGSAVSPFYTFIQAGTVTGQVPSNFQLHFGTSYNGSNISTRSSFVSEPFDFAYTSGIIDADPIPPEDGLLLRVPSSYYDSPDSPYNYDIHDIVNTYPSVNDPNGHELVFDPHLNPDFDVDLDMGNMLGDLITAIILAKLADLLGDDSEVIYSPMPEKDDPIEPGIIDPLPDPDPAPDIPEPGTTIADTDWTLLDELLRWIQSTIDSIRHITEALQTLLDSIIEGINDILESIRELADKILEDIELGPAKLFDKVLDILKTLFLPLLLPIRAMMNLWHYVVEWIGSISSPFTWIFGIMFGTSVNMVLPIYALLAGGICISIYKALGR